MPPAVTMLQRILAWASTLVPPAPEVPQTVPEEPVEGVEEKKVSPNLAPAEAQLSSTMDPPFTEETDEDGGRAVSLSDFPIAIPKAAPKRGTKRKRCACNAIAYPNTQTYPEHPHAAFSATCA